MNIKYFIILLFAVVSSTANAQLSSINEPCDFWQKVNFKNGRDTILVSGKYIACTKIHHSTTLKSLAAKGIVNLKNFTYMVGFLPDGCKNEQAAECADTTGILYTIKPETYTKPVIYRCIFFEGLFRDKEKKVPYFIVDKTIVNE